MSDGRANVARDGARDRTRALSDARAAAQRFRCAGVASVFIDTGRWPSAETETLAREMGARYAPLPFANADAVSALAQA
jgi:magnesium chelatase subunit D